MAVFMGVQDGAGVTPSTHFIKSFFHQPFKFMEFPFIVLGNPFVAYSYEPRVMKKAIFWGLFLTVLSATAFVRLARRRSKVKAMDELLINRPEVMLTVINLGIMLMLRFPFLGREGALEVRYSSMAVFSVVSILFYFYKTMDLGRTGIRFYSWFCLLIGLFCFYVGYPVGKNWVRERYLVYQNHVSCFSRHQKSNYVITDPCVKAMFPEGMWSEKDFLRWLNLLQDKKLSFFSKIGKP
jgi:hypothetical protein